MLDSELLSVASLYCSVGYFALIQAATADRVLSIPMSVNASRIASASVVGAGVGLGVCAFFAICQSPWLIDQSPMTLTITPEINSGKCALSIMPKNRIGPVG